MNREIDAARFVSTEQYCAFLDKALMTTSAILTNGWLLASDADKIIGDDGLFYHISEGAVSILIRNESYYALQYIAQKDAVLSIPHMPLPVLCNLKRMDGADDPANDELLERSGLMLKRINVGMELVLKHRVPLGEDMNEMMIDYALEQDLEEIFLLLYESFDPILDDLPSREQLTEYIQHGHALVVRNPNQVVAALIRKPKGACVVFGWIATDTSYKRCGLSWNLQDAMERICEEQGYKRSMVWINASNVKWIQRTQNRGYRLNGQRMYSYMPL